MNESPTNFRLRFDVVLLQETGCNHGLNDPLFFDDECRACSVNKQITDSALVIAWEEEFYARIFSGSATTSAQRIALARLIAFVQGHPEPLNLPGSEKALAKLK